MSSNENDNPAVVLRLKDEEIPISDGTLVSVQRAVVDFLRRSHEQLWRDLADDLEKSMPFVGERGRIGQWVLEERDGTPILVRVPFRAKVMHQFVAVLAKKGEVWSVTEFLHKKLYSR